MSRLRVGVVGVGALGRHHARILSQLESVELVGVAETNAETGRAVARQCGTSWFGDYRELFERVEAVSIVVPTFAHESVGSEFLRRGIPVLMEKPLAGSVASAERLVELADGHDALLQVGHIERFNPATRVAWKECGTPRYVRAERFSPFAFRSMDIGAVHDLMIHDIDLVLDLVRSRVMSVEAFGVSLLGGHEDTAHARLRFESGCIADLAAHRVCPTSRRKLDIWTTTGYVGADLSAREVVCHRPTETLLYGVSPLERAKQPGADIEQLKREMFGTYLREARPAVPQADALTDELRHFVDCVQSGRTPACSGREGLEAMRVAGQVLASIAAHAESVAGIPQSPRQAAPRRMAG